MTPDKRILLVEDDQALAEMIEDFLRQENFQVSRFNDGLSACRALDQHSYDLVLLDLMLPGCDGLEVCRHLRKTSNTPVLMLTAKNDDMVAAASLQLGVDNYLKKPIRPHLLLAHIEAMLRRSQLNQATPIEALTLDKQSYTAYLKGEALDLTTGEYELLSYFYERSGQVISREALYLDIRGIPFDGIDRAIDLKVSTLRKKLQDDTPPYLYIKTVRGKGYLLVPS